MLGTRVCPSCLVNHTAEQRMPIFMDCILVHRSLEDASVIDCQTKTGCTLKISGLC